MDGVLAINDLNDLTAKLSTAVTLMAKYGKAYAAAERDYKVALSQEALKLRAEDMPVIRVLEGQIAREWGRNE